MLPEGFKGMIFDLDGTLISSGYVWAEVDRCFLSRRGIDVPDDYCKAVSAMNFLQAAEYTKARFGLSDSIPDIISEWRSQAIAEYRDNVKALPFAKEYLALLKQKGIKIALATASDRGLYEPALRRNGMYDYFDFFAQTSDVERGKGFPDVYEYAARGLGLAPSECAVFEDIIEGIEGAKLGGFYAVAVYSTQYAADWEKMQHTADMCIVSYFQLASEG